MVVEPRQPTGEMCGQVLGQRHETPPAQPLPTATNDAAQPALALPLQLLNSSSFMKAGSVVARVSPNARVRQNAGLGSEGQAHPAQRLCRVHSCRSLLWRCGNILNLPVESGSA